MRSFSQRLELPPPLKVRQTKRTLVVDDEPDFALTFACMLEAIGWEASVVTDAQLVLETVARIDAELVFLDLHMPAVDGLDLARALRKRYGWQRLRIVAVTGFGDPEHRAATREAGFDAHVLKPVDMQILESTLHTLFPEMRWMTKPQVGKPSQI